MAVRDRIRGDLLDGDMLTHLEGCGSINWIAATTWQCQAVSAGGVAGGAESEWVNVDQLKQYLEVSMMDFREWAWLFTVVRSRLVIIRLNTWPVLWWTW